MVVNRKEHARHSKRVTATRRWQVLRNQILERDGWKCRSCGEMKRLEVDHIKPVRTHPELSFDPRNLQLLCGPCHTKKTRIECGHKEKSPDRKAWELAVASLESGSWSIPHGMRPSSIPITIVCGPPGAGKTTYIEEHAGPTDTVIDFDVYLRAVGGVIWDRDPAIVKAAFLLRNEALHRLASQTRGRAWFALTAPSADERKEWKRQLVRASVVILEVPAEVCKTRIKMDAERQHAIPQMCAGVDSWWRIYAADFGGSIQTKRTDYA